MQKKLTVLFILFILLFTLSGCAEASYSVTFFESDAVIEYFGVDLNREAIELAGYDYYDIQDTVLGCFEDVREGLISNFNASGNWSTLKEKQDILNSVMAPNIRNDKISLTFWFLNIEHYKAFYDIQDNEVEQTSNVIVEDKIFFIKQTTVTKTVFQGFAASNLATELLEYFETYPDAEIIFDLDDLKLTYSYANEDLKLFSNADSTYIRDNIKIHEWKIPRDNYDINIEFYKYQIVSTWWYVLALALTVLFIMGILLYNLIKNIVIQKNTNQQLK